MPNIKRLIHIFIIINVILIILFVLILLNNHLNNNSIINSIFNKKYNLTNDIIRPDIILNDSDITIYIYEEYQEPGYKALDNIDGDITNKVKIDSNVNNKQPGTYTITYSVTDSSGNKTELTKDITFSDNEKPNITLKGKSAIYVNLNGTYTEPGVTIHILQLKLITKK